MTRLSMLGLVFLLAACNLRVPEDLTPPSIPGSNSSPTQAQPTDPADCVIDTTLPVYVVQPGDNLTNIAQSLGSTVDAIVAANCLVDRNRLDRGQELYVPSVEAVNPCLPPESSGTDYLVITPSTAITENCLELRGGRAVEVSWPNAPAGLVEVTFYRTNDQLARPDVIGVDDDPSDGFAIQWQPFATTPDSLIYAIGLGGEGGVSDQIGVIIR